MESQDKSAMYSQETWGNTNIAEQGAGEILCVIFNTHVQER